MPTYTTTYLQVPKVLPHRPRKSRSKSGPRKTTDSQISDSTAHLFPRASAKTALPPPTYTSEVDVAPPPYAAHMEMATGASTYTPSQSPYTKDRSRSTSPNKIDTTTAIYSTPSSPSTYHVKAADSTNANANNNAYTLTASSSPTHTLTPTPQHPTLRQRLPGTWRLESYIAYPTPTSPIQRPTYPMTKNLTGLIMYTHDGYMSAHMLIPGQKSFKRGEGDDAQWAEAGKRCFAYAGPYYISDEEGGSGEGEEEGEGEGETADGTGTTTEMRTGTKDRREVLRHTFQVCSLPGWMGDIQVRTWAFEEDGQVLVLGSAEPTEIKVSSLHKLFVSFMLVG